MPKNLDFDPKSPNFLFEKCNFGHVREKTQITELLAYFQQLEFWNKNWDF